MAAAALGARAAGALASCSPGGLAGSMAAAAQLAAKGEQGPSSPALSAATDESLSLGQTDSDSGGGDKW